MKRLNKCVTAVTACVIWRLLICLLQQVCVIGELVLLNRSDINFEERECVVFGKGSKERMVYFDARTKIHLQNYLESRTDNNKALFVSLKAPHTRITIGGIESRLRQYGEDAEYTESPSSQIPSNNGNNGNRQGYAN